MKRIFITIITCLVVFACKNDKELILNIDVPTSSIRFTPFEGGATMHYALPKNKDAHYIVAEYLNFKNEKVVVKGSYLSNSIVLKGFVDKTTNVPVEVYITNKNGVKSASQMLEFSTLRSAAMAFFDELKVGSYWGGFKLKYNAPEISNGFVNIGVVGTNQTTGKTDTLLIETLTIEPGQNEYIYADPTTEKENNTVVVWTEDFYGNRVKKQVFQNVQVARTTLFNSSNIVFYGSSFEFPRKGASSSYLFDGDKNGEAKVRAGFGSSGFLFASDRNQEPGFWVFDLQESKTIGIVKMYCHLNTGHGYLSYIWGGGPEYLSPNHVKIYGSNDADLPLDQWRADNACDNSGNWDLLGEFHQPQSTPEDKRWTAPINDPQRLYTDVDAIRDAESAFIEIKVDLTGKSYRYLRMEVLETFHFGSRGDGNTKNRVSLSEFEVYVKK